MDVFTRMVTQQRDAAAPLLQPALPPHFARARIGAPMAGWLDIEGQDAASPAAPKSRTQPTSTARGVAAHAADRSDPATPFAGAHTALPPRPQHPTAAPGDRSPAWPVAPQAPAVGVSRDRAPVASLRNAANAPSDGRPPGRRVERPDATPPLRHAVDAGTRGAPHLRPASPPFEWPAPPLSNAWPHAATALQAAPPVVHLHIERIEVRAPVAPPRPAPARATQRPAPETTLADYLRGSRRE